MAGDSPHYIFGPRAQGSVILGLRPGQVVVLNAGLAAAVTALLVAPMGANVALAVAAVLVAAAVAFVPTAGGRTLEQWLPVVARWGWRRATGASHWRSPAPTEGHAPSGELIGRPPPALSGVEIVGIDLGGGHELGVAVEPDRGAYTAVLQADGEGLGLLDSAEQRQRLQAWAEVLAGFGGEASPIARVQWVQRSVPDEGDELGRDLRDRTAVPPSAPSMASYLELLDDAAPAVREHEVYVAVQITERRAARLLRGARGAQARRQAAGEVLGDQLRRLDRRLARAGLRVIAGALPPRRLAEVLYTAADPCARGELARRALHVPQAAGCQPGNAWPLRGDETWRAYATDSGWHATYWIAEWPRTPVGADFLAPLLLESTAQRTVSVVMEPVGHATAVREAEAARTNELAEAQLRQSKGFVESWRKRREAEATERRAAELQEGYAEFRFSGYVTVTAADADELDDACAALNQAAGQAGLQLRRLDGDHDTAWTYTLPLARGLQ